MLEVLAWFGLLLWGGRCAWLVLSPLTRDRPRARTAATEHPRSPAPPETEHRVSSAALAGGPVDTGAVRRHFGDDVLAMTPGESREDAEVVVVTRASDLFVLRSQPETPVLVVRGRR